MTPNPSCLRGGSAMLDIGSARSSTHRSNIARYRRLLETNLTELERDYIQRRMAEELTNLETLGLAASTFSAADIATA
jgi:predicted house-cleaning noncanonical NTP pyrophosphatase (MazG superfamily)